MPRKQQLKRQHSFLISDPRYKYSISCKEKTVSVWVKIGRMLKKIMLYNGNGKLHIYPRTTILDVEKNGTYRQHSVLLYIYDSCVRLYGIRISPQIYTVHQCVTLKKKLFVNELIPNFVLLP